MGDPIGFAIEHGWSDKASYGYGDIVGISKDGHMIYGPYNADGDFWGCDEHDICNGTFVEGNYVYVSTKNFPYVLGCFGPGPQQDYEVTCSEGSCPQALTKFEREMLGEAGDEDKSGASQLVFSGAV